MRLTGTFRGYHEGQNESRGVFARIAVPGVDGFEYFAHLLVVLGFNRLFAQFQQFLALLCLSPLRCIEHFPNRSHYEIGIVCRSIRFPFFDEIDGRFELLTGLEDRIAQFAQGWEPLVKNIDRRQRMFFRGRG